MVCSARRYGVRNGEVGTRDREVRDGPRSGGPRKRSVASARARVDLNGLGEGHPFPGAVRQPNVTRSEMHRAMPAPV